MDWCSVEYLYSFRVDIAGYFGFNAFVHAVANKAINPSFAILFNCIVSATGQLICRKSYFMASGFILPGIEIVQPSLSCWQRGDLAAQLLAEGSDWALRRKYNLYK